MAELLDAYQRTHETMGTLAKNVGKNNEVLQNTTVQLDEYSSTIGEHHKQIELLSKTQDVQTQSIKSLHESVAMLSEVASMHSSRIDLMVARINELERVVERTHKHIFWYLLVVLVINVGSLIYWLSL